MRDNKYVNIYTDSSGIDFEGSDFFLKGSAVFLSISFFKTVLRTFDYNGYKIIEFSATKSFFILQNP